MRRQEEINAHAMRPSGSPDGLLDRNADGDLIVWQENRQACWLFLLSWERRLGLQDGGWQGLNMQTALELMAVDRVPRRDRMEMVTHLRIIEGAALQVFAKGRK